jgi:hypothetical protein
MLIPALIDSVEPPRPLANLDYLDLTHRDPEKAAKEIDAVLARRMPKVRLFISHAHADADVASELVDVIELYYRLEQLRLLGFVAKVELGESDGDPVFGWTLSDNYRRDIGQ